MTRDEQKRQRERLRHAYRQKVPREEAAAKARVPQAFVDANWQIFERLYGPQADNGDRAKAKAEA